MDWKVDSRIPELFRAMTVLRIIVVILVNT